MFKAINDLYTNRIDLLMKKGMQQNEIIPFDDEFYNKLKNTYVSCIPADINVKYVNYSIEVNDDYSKNFQIFMSLKDSKLVYADTKYFKMNSHDKSVHSWVEIDDYVIDAYFMMKFKKELYYKIIVPSNLVKYNHEEFRKENTELYDEIINTTMHDFYPGGSKRCDLIYEIPNALSYARMSGNTKLIEELKEYLLNIQYDEREVIEEINNKASKLNK